MKDDPAVPGSPLTSMPTRSNTLGVRPRRLFFRLRWPRGIADEGRTQWRNAMNQSKPTVNQPKSTVAEQIARAASTFEERRTGHAPRSVTVVLTEHTLVITLHGVLSEAEKAVAKDPAGAAKVQEFHRQLFANSSEWLRQEIKRISGVEVGEAAAEVEPATGTVVHAFTTGTVVQVFLLAQSVAADTWSGDGRGDRDGQADRSSGAAAATWKGDGRGKRL